MDLGRRAAVLLSLVWLVLTLGGCRRERSTPTAEPARGAQPQAAASATTDARTVEVLVAYGSEKKEWLEEQLTAFNSSTPRLATGEIVKVAGKALGSGEAMQDILSERLLPVVFSPASSAYITLINDAWLEAQHTRPLAHDAESIVISPIVIAMWRPMAEALGWPAKPLGWADVLKISKNARGWEAFGRPEWGTFKLGHTHPEYSNSGLLAVLAEAYAGSPKTRRIDLADFSNPKLRSFVESIERSVVHYGKSTGFFAERMLARGPSYLSAAVLYENLVADSYSRPSAAGLDLVAIYPREGTFWSDHPYAVLDAPWVSTQQKQAAGQLLSFLKTRAAQERALAFGFRPADPSVAVTAPIDSAHGCDPKEPQTLLEVPNGAALRGLAAMFHELKKPSDVTLVFDKSGSMAGEPLRQAKAGARAFLESLTPRDQASIEFFDEKVYPLIGPFKIGEKRDELLQRVDQVVASGGTALYQALADAYRDAKSRVRADDRSIRALVVMTDGKDESSSLTLPELEQGFPREGQDTEVRVFTIAYGTGASSEVLAKIANAGGGSHTKGTVGDIVQVYRDIASFF